MLTVTFVFKEHEITVEDIDCSVNKFLDSIEESNELHFGFYYIEHRGAKYSINLNHVETLEILEQLDE